MSQNTRGCSQQDWAVYLWVGGRVSVSVCERHCEGRRGKMGKRMVYKNEPSLYKLFPLMSMGMYLYKKIY